MDAEYKQRIERLTKKVIKEQSLQYGFWSVLSSGSNDRFAIKLQAPNKDYYQFNVDIDANRNFDSDDVLENEIAKQIKTAKKLS